MKPKRRPFPLAPGTVVSVYPGIFDEEDEDWWGVYSDYVNTNREQVDAAGWLYVVCFVGTVSPDDDYYHDPDRGSDAVFHRLQGWFYNCKSIATGEERVGWYDIELLTQDEETGD